MRFKPADVAIIAIFSAIWAALNLTIGPLGFTLFHLPIFCDFSVYFTLLLATWASCRTGVASMVGVIGAIIVLAMRPASTQMVGFLASAILFDTLMTFCKHEIKLKPFNLVVASVTTIISAYFAGSVIGTVFMGKSLEWSLTFWGVWHLVGGIIGLIIALPVIGMLERAKVKELQSGHGKGSLNT